jgi:hypothetical protein
MISTHPFRNVPYRSNRDYKCGFCSEILLVKTISKSLVLNEICLTTGVDSSSGANPSRSRIPYPVHHHRNPKDGTQNYPYVACKGFFSLIS